MISILVARVVVLHLAKNIKMLVIGTVGVMISTTISWSPSPPSRSSGGKGRRLPPCKDHGDHEIIYNFKNVKIFSMLIKNIMIMISTHCSSSWSPSWWQGSSSSTLQRPCWLSVHQRLQEYRDFYHVAHKHTSDHDLNSHFIIITKIMMTTKIIIKITSSLKSSWIGASSTRLLGSSTPCNILINIFFFHCPA